MIKMQFKTIGRLIILFAFFWSNSLYSQCDDVIKEAKEKINSDSPNRDYEKAINLLLYAQRICPDERKEEINDLITRTFKLITTEKDRAISAESQAKRDRDRAVSAEKETKKTAISALNSALALELTATNPTLAIRVAEYNLRKNPNDESVHDMFRQIYSQEHLYYKLSLNAHNLPVRAVDISKNSQYLVTASMDGKTNIWDLDGTLITTFNHIESIYDISFSDDDEYIDTYVTDKNYRTRKIRWSFNGEQISDEVIDSKSNLFYTNSFIDPNGYLVNNPQFSYVTNGVDTVEISRLLGHQTIVTNALGQEACIYDAAISKDGRYLLTGGADKTAKLWMIPPSKKTKHKTFLPEAAGTVLKNQLTRNNEYYYEVKKEYTNDNSPVSALSFSPDEEYFAIVFYDLIEYSNILQSNGYIYETSSKDKISSFSQEGIIYDIKFSKENTIVTKNTTGQLSDWKFDKGLEGSLVNDSIMENPQTKIDINEFLFKISDFGKYYLGKNEISIENFDDYEKYINSLIDTLRRPYLIFDNISKDSSSSQQVKGGITLPSRPLNYLSIKSESEKHLLTANKKGEAVFWEKSNDFFPEIKALDYRWTRNLGFSEDGKYFYFSSDKVGEEKREYSQWEFQKTTDLVILLTALSEGWTKEFKVLNQNGDYNRVKSISLSDDGNFLAATFEGDKYCLIVWDVISENIILELPDFSGFESNQYYDTGSNIESVKFLPTSNQLLGIRGNPGTSAVFINLDGKISELKIPLNAYPIDSPIFEISKKGTFLLIGGPFSTGAKTVEVWDYKRGNKIASITNPYDIECAVFLPKSNHIAIGSQDGSIKIFNLEGTLLNTIEGHKGYVYDLEISPTENMVYSTGRDNYLRCWNINGNEIWNKAFSAEISDLALYPPGDFILTSGNGGLNMVSTKESLLDFSICEFDAYDYFIAGLHINENEASTDLEYEILALEYEQNRDWDSAINFYNKSNNTAISSRAFLLEEAANFDQFEAYLDVTNGPVLLRFFQTLNETIITEENELRSLYEGYDEQNKGSFLKTKKNFVDIIHHYKKAILFSEKSRVISLVGNDLCNYINTLAWYCILSQKGQEAEGLILEGIKRCGNSLDLKIRLITILLAQKKYAEARKILSGIFFDEKYDKRNSFYYQAPFYTQFQQIENKTNREALLAEIEFFESLGILDSQNSEFNKLKNLIRLNTASNK